ncbi:MAG TPA: hypothetical protein PK360_06010, partial [bacterium]|nr:hypothetical protein [bacterium]
LLPIAGIFIGLSFAWGGNALALLQPDEIEEMTDYHSGGFEYYVYTYQMAILAILATLVVWGLAGLDLFDLVWPTKSSMSLYFVIKFILYFLGSVALRECWQVVLSAQLLLLARKKIKKHKINNQANSKRDE